MENIRITSMLIGAILILFGYLRLITDEKGNVPLNNYRFTGALNLVFRGMIDGTNELFSRNTSKVGHSALAIYLGLFLFFIGFYM